MPPTMPAWGAPGTPVPTIPYNPTGSQFYSSSSTSGINPASGESGALSGPWMVEIQSMDYDYVRVPFVEMSSTQFTLSDTSWDGNVKWTHMQINARAFYQVKKTYENYATSSWIQNQRFAVQAVSADPYGNTYGSVSAGTFGPAGKIVTEQEWYYRRYWNDATDTEYSKTMDGGYTFYVTDAGAAWTWGTSNGGFDSANGTPQYVVWGNYDRTLQSYEEGAPMEGCRVTRQSTDNQNDGPVVMEGDYFTGIAMAVNTKWGGYKTTQDTNQDVAVTTNSLGGWIRAEEMMKNGAVGDVMSNDNRTGISEYSEFRHAWN